MYLISVKCYIKKVRELGSLLFTSYVIKRLIIINFFPPRLCDQGCKRENRSIMTLHNIVFTANNGLINFEFCMYM